MALTGKKHEAFYVTTGSSVDKIDSNKLTEIEAIWNADKSVGCVEYINDPFLGPLVFQLQQMQDELDYLRTEISSNKDKTSMALGTSGSTALAGDTNIVTIGSSTTIAFGDMITTVTGKAPKTTTTYSIVMTVTNGGVSKSTTLTLT